MRLFRSRLNENYFCVGSVADAAHVEDLGAIPDDKLLDVIKEINSAAEKSRAPIIDFGILQK